MAAIEPKFEETQQYREWGFWIIVSLIFLFPFIIRLFSIMELGLWGAFGKGILVHIIIIGLIILLFIIAKTDLLMDKSGVRIRYFPFSKKKFSWEEIEEAKMINYNFQEIRGKGIRFWTHYGIIQKLKGNRGLFLKLKNGKTYLISTQKPAELKQTIKHYI